MDAPGQVEHDHACGEFFLARYAGRRDRCGWSSTEEKSPGLADEVQFGKQTAADLSNRRGLVCLRSAGVSGRDFRTHRPRRKTMGRLIAPFRSSEIGAAMHNQGLWNSRPGKNKPGGEIGARPRKIRQI